MKIHKKTPTWLCFDTEGNEDIWVRFFREENGEFETAALGEGRLSHENVKTLIDWLNNPPEYSTGEQSP